MLAHSLVTGDEHFIGSYPQEQSRLNKHVVECTYELHGKQLLPAVVPALHNHTPQGPALAAALRGVAFDSRLLWGSERGKSESGPVQACHAVPMQAR